MRERRQPDAASCGVLGEGTPAGSDLQDVAVRAEPARVEAEIELPALGDFEWLVRALEDPLRVAARAAEEAEVELRIEVVVRLDRARVGADLAEDERLDEAPGVVERMEIREVRAQVVHREQVALDVEVAVQVGVGDPAEVERAECRERAGGPLAHAA